MMQDTHRGYTELRQVTDGSSESATNETAVAYYNPRTRDVAWMDEDITLPNWTDYYTHPLYTTPPDHREVMQQALEAHDKRYQVVRDGYWWRVRIGDGTQTVGQHHTETGALRLASELHRAFHDGGFVVQAALCAALGEKE